MNFLIVDDEQSICDLTAIKIKDMNDSRIETVSCAYSAEGALYALQKERYDVLITDICMGGIDGLELIKRTRSLFPELICILISAHDQFEYAKQGIRLGIYDFWVKPYSVKNMQKSIEEIIEHYNKNQIKKCDQLDAMLNEAILTGSKPVGSIFHYCGMNIPYRNIMIIAWRDKAASGTMFGKTKGVWYYYPSGKTYMIVSYKSDDMQALTYWLQSVSNVLDQTIAGSIPNCEFSLMYKQAEKMLEYDWVWDTNRVLIYQDEAKNQQVSDYIRRILKYTIAYDVKFVIEEIEKARLAVSDAIFCRIISEVYKQKSKELLEMSSSYRIDILAENDTVQPKAGWKNSIYQILYEIKQIKKFKMSLSKNDPVKWAKEYVDSHIGNEIDMSVVANELNISYQYFSKIFREKENISFSEYVQEMRMKEACRLLLEGNKITVISEKTGYKNANNFAKAFKKMYGASPKSFRNELLI